ncbi:protein of unknown function [Thiomonas sp. Bio17B3]|nr:protein of unknown function [Thiomonas sp. Bio17B3]VDY08898.1 protein of unknown function [Thiomonas sp. Sup16B3]VDY12176.1 protein of unknown function [Thiomonas sp. OC7]VDY18609.1 protein of unknown function [Thiomonas sp. CB2]
MARSNRPAANPADDSNRHRHHTKLNTASNTLVFQACIRPSCEMRFGVVCDASFIYINIYMYIYKFKLQVEAIFL